MTIRMTIVAALAGALFAVPGCKERHDSTAGLDPGDQEFVKTATQANLAEIDLGKLAQKKAENTDVKRFGEHMVDDHKKGYSELSDLAGKKNIAIPREPDPDQQKTAARLSELNGAAFDRRYMEVMVDDHTKVVALFESHAMTGKDADIRSFAEKSLPMLRRHLTMAREVFAKTGGQSP